MNAAVQSVAFDAPRAIAPEDQARADYYALLAALFYGAPDDRLLQAIVIAVEPPALTEAAPLVAGWRALAAAAAHVTHDAVADEYERLFIGVGKPDVMLFGSHYLAGFMNEKPLAQLRDNLLALGLRRNAASTEPEDHIAAECDVMRFLILGDLDTRPAAIEDQRRFFAVHLQPWVFKFCAATAQSGNANFYRRVAAFAQAFFTIETEAFAI